MRLLRNIEEGQHRIKNTVLKGMQEQGDPEYLYTSFKVAQQIYKANNSELYH